MDHNMKKGGAAMFSNRALRKLLIPLIIEQILTSLMGMVDTMMVSNVGTAAVSGVSLVDSINKLVIFLLTALATGGTIVCSQYFGRRDRENANLAARQVLLSAFALSLALMALCLLFRRGLLALIFGTVEPAVMDAAARYFLITALSYPFLALFNGASALFRAAGNSRLPMLVSACSNLLNIAGNAFLIFGLDMGVTGAAIATTVSFALGAVTMLICLRRQNQTFDIGPYTAIRPDWPTIGRVLRVGIPTGIENGMFQFGKLVLQSTVSTLGTTAIASNAIIVVLELMSSMPSQAIGIGLVTVAGQCMGAGRPDEARRYIRKLTGWSALVLLCMNWLIYALAGPVCSLAGLDAETRTLTMDTLLLISLVKPFLWALAFVPADGMRAAGDVRFGMLVSSLSMWCLRVGLTTLLCRVWHVGLVGIWIGYFADWAARSLAFALRFRSGKWARHRVIEP